ncbi:MAG: hypothetical protein HRU15_20780 [Planctomycetes bacterium]|nr:hypothetical protein [Planctomycetota bacterium]
MLLERVPELGLVDGWNDTFDGENPCALCHAIDESTHNNNTAAEQDKRELNFTALCSRHAQTLDHSAQWLNGLKSLQLWHLNCFHSAINKRPPIS